VHVPTHNGTWAAHCQILERVTDEDGPVGYEEPKETPQDDSKNTVKNHEPKETIKHKSRTFLDDL
jgi:hypothetical protein